MTDRHGRVVCRFAGRIRRDVEAGLYPEGQFLPSIRELSERHGVAKGTAERALRLLSSEGLIVSRPRRGYLRPLTGKDTATGYPTAYIYSGMYSTGPGDDWDEDAARRTLNEFERLAAHRSQSLLVLKATDRAPDDILAQLSAARASAVVTDALDPAFLDKTKELGLPTVVIDNIGEGYDIDTVAQDGWLGGLYAARELARRGHRRIGWLGPEPLNSDPQIAERLGGVLGGLARAGLDLPGDLRVSAPIGHAEEARRIAREFLARPDRPKAFFAIWQDMTAALAGAANDLGLVPGRDFDFVGWCTREQYDAGYLAGLGVAASQAMLVWSVAEMAKTAMARLTERRTTPDLPCVALKIPVHLV